MAKQRLGLEAAAKAADAFATHMGYESGVEPDETVMADLIADLMHLADTRLLSGYWIWEKAGEHYGIEEGTSDDEDEEDDFGQTQPDPEVVGAPKPTDCTIPCDGTGWTGNPRERCLTHYEL